MYILYNTCAVISCKNLYVDFLYKCFFFEFCNSVLFWEYILSLPFYKANIKENI